jgi:predicted ester cyclase
LLSELHLIASDVVRHCEATPGVEARSLDQVKEFLRQDTAVFPDSVQTTKLLIAEGNLVAAWTTYEGTQQGPMGPFPPSGLTFRRSPSEYRRNFLGTLGSFWAL